MKRRYRWLLALLLLVAASFLLPAVHWRLIGWVRGEAFYQGRPTSYWRSECQCWRWNPPCTGPGYWCRFRSDDRYSWIEKYLPVPKMALLQGDPGALPVLLELLDVDEAAHEVLTVSALHNLGPAARPAVPRLMDLVQRRGKIEGHIYQALLAMDSQAAVEAMAMIAPRK
jgi:hypothetical protein